MHCFLGHDIRRENNGSWETSAKTSIHKAAEKYGQELGDMLLAKRPAVTHEHPEEDRYVPLNLLCTHYYQTIIGCLNWNANLGRIDVAWAKPS